MRICVPLFGDRVAPRCTHADSVLLCTLTRGRIVEQERIRRSIDSLLDLEDVLRNRKVDTLVCGGINHTDRSAVDPLLEAVVPNVAGTVEDVLLGVSSGRIGLEEKSEATPETAASTAPITPESSPAPIMSATTDCLTCDNMTCLEGRGCVLQASGILLGDRDDRIMLEVARDLNCEDERRLCRLSELIYFGLEMGYRTIGIAYCSDLYQPARVLAGVFKRFFEVHAVCCKLHVPGNGHTFNADMPDPSTRCNPLAQAELLNKLGTDMNVIVGLCVGADCVFTRASDAPVTTLFAKDRALANNPIGAVYSERYLREAAQTLASPQTDLRNHQAIVERESMDHVGDTGRADS
ncbi:DUF1847 domain-containing protein [bacterium]|nr:DUF1847 domain-containing protein [bacterium]